MFLSRWRKWLNRFQPTRPIRRPTKRRGRQPTVEVLEDRTLPTVTSQFVGPISLSVAPNVNVSKEAGNQVEELVFVNPTNPANIIAVSNDATATGSANDPSWYSSDGGATWNYSAIPNVGVRAPGGDPQIVFDRTGRAVFVHLDTVSIVLSGKPTLVFGIASAVSTDGGQTWTAAAVDQPTGKPDDDREILAVGPDHNNLAVDRFYLTWQRNGVIFSSSSADGLNWTAPVQVSDASTGASIAASVAVGPDGTVYTAWQDHGTTAGVGRVMFDKSTDDGASWGTDANIYNSNVNVFNDPFTGGFYTIPAQTPRGLEMNINVAVDGSNGPHRGRVYVSLTDSVADTPAASHDDTNIFLMHSDNGGGTFTPAVRVNDDATNRSQFMSALSVDPNTGFVALTWHDCRNDSGVGPGSRKAGANNDAQYWGTISSDGGATFLPNVQISAGTSDEAAEDPPSGGFLDIDYGDYSGVSFFGGVFNPVWVDNSNSTGDNADGAATKNEIYTAAVTLTGNQVVNVFGDEDFSNEDDAFLIKLDSTGTFIQFYVNGKLEYTTTKLAVVQINVNGLGGNDALTVDSTNGPIGVVNGIRYDGGTGSDRLDLQQTGGDTQTSDTLAVGATPGNGRSTIVGPSGTQVVDFDNIEPVTDTALAASFTITSIPGLASLLDGSNAINYTAGQLLVGGGRVTVDNFEPIEFTNKSTLILNAGAGSDEINLNNPSVPTGLTGITVNGGDPTGSDTLIVNGTTGADAINFSPTAPDAGTVQVNALPLVTMATVEHVTINGQRGDDALIITTPANYNLITYTPGAALDSASVQFDALVPMSFANLGFAFDSTVSFADANGDRIDELVYNGTATDDLFDVADEGGGFIRLNGRVDLFTPGVTHLTLNGLDGDDKFQITGPLPYLDVTLSGGDPSHSDTAYLTGDGTAVTVALAGTPASTVTGGGLGFVSLLGVEIVNLFDGAGDIAVSGTIGPDSFSVTPTGANTATIQANGVSPVLNTSNSGTFAIDGLGNTSDVLTVNATEGNDTIAVSGSAVNVSSQLGIGLAGFERVNVNGLAGDDDFTVTPSPMTTFFIDGGPPIGATAGDRLTVAAGGNIVTPEPGPENDEGSFVIGGGNLRVSYDHIEAVAANGASGASVTGTNGNDVITIIARDDSYNPMANGVQDFTVSVNDGPDVLFINTPFLPISALSGDDKIVIQAPAPNHAVWNVAVAINGGPPDASDQVEVGTPGTDNVIYSPTGVNAGTLNIVNLASMINLIGVEHLVYGGLAGDDTLTVTTPAGADVITLDPGALADAGTVTLRRSGGLGGSPLLGINFTNLGLGGTLNFAETDGGRTDELTVNGRDLANASDLFTVSAAGNVALSAPAAGGATVLRLVEVQTPGVGLLGLNGLAGDDIFDVPGNHPFTMGIFLDGGEPSASDAVVFHGGGAPLIANLAAGTIAETGFGPVGLRGIEAVSLNTSGGALMIAGTAGDDTFDVTPTGLGAGSFQATFAGAVVGHSPNFTYAGLDTAAFIVNGGAGFDVLAVLGTTGADVVTSGASTVTSNGGTITASSGLERLDVSTFDGNDNVNLAAFTALPTRIDAGAGDDTVVGSPQADTVHAGDGNDIVNGGGGPDVLFGDDGDDRLDGDAGSDQMFGGPGNDVFVWDPGDGSDLVEGGTGDADVLLFNGAAAAEVFTLNPNGDRFQFLRNVGAISMDVAEVEQVDLNALGGADSTTVNDLSGTSVRLINLDLGAGDGAADAVTVNGRGADDNVSVGVSGSVISVTGLPWTVRISNAAAATDRLIIEGNDGNDTLRAEFGAQDAIALTLDGNGGNDTLTGGATVIGGPGIDTLDLSAAPGVGINLNAFTPQAAGPFGRVQLGDVIENFRGSPAPDALEVIPLATGRDINGAGGGDLLNFNSGGLPVLAVTATSLYTLGLAPVTIHGIGRINWIGTTAANVTPIMWVNYRPKRFRGRQGRFDAVFTFRNVSDVAIEGPFGLFLENLTRGVRVLNRSGFTGDLGKVGSPFVRFAAGDQLINPGEEFRVVLKFFSARRRNVHFQPGVAAGSGPY